jgi:hypothetical protein
LIQLALVINKYIKSRKSENVVCEILLKINDWSSLHNDYSLNIYFREFLKTVRENNRISQIVNERIVDILSELINGESNINDATQMLEDFIWQYSLNLRFEDTHLIEEHFEDLLSEYIYEEIEELKEIITSEEEASEKKTEILKIISRLNGSGLTISTNLEEFDDEDWLTLAIDNEFRRQMEKDD